MISINLREMKEEDIREVLSIEIESFTTPWTRISFYEEISNPHSIVRVAETSGKIVGYICASFVFEEGHILTVSVHPLYRRMGVANRLVGHILALLKEKGCTKVFLEVRAGNKPAIELYRKFGFRDISRRRDYYRLPREDAIIMMLAY